MKAIYDLMQAGGEITLQSGFYRVLDGTCRADVSALNTLILYANAHGCYLRKHDMEAAEFLLKIADTYCSKYHQKPKRKT